MINIVMRFGHDYISLCVKGELSEMDAKGWFDVVRRVAPNGTLSSASIMVDGRAKSSDFYVKKEGNDTHYVVPLSRDLLEDEAARIAIAWDRTYPKGDFSVDFSQHEQAQLRKKEMQATLIEEISERVAKMFHSEWINSKVKDGWNYGPDYSMARKQNPMLLPWSQLSERKRADETARVAKLFEILDAINLRLVAK